MTIGKPIDIFMRTGWVKNCKGCQKKLGYSLPIVPTVITMRRKIWNIYKRQITAKDKRSISRFRNPAEITAANAPFLVERCTRCGTETVVRYHDIMNPKKRKTGTA